MQVSLVIGYSERTKAVIISSGRAPAWTRSISLDTSHDKLHKALQQLKRMLSWWALAKAIKLVATPSFIICFLQATSADKLQNAMEHRDKFTSSLILETMFNPLVAPALTIFTRQDGAKVNEVIIAAAHTWILVLSWVHSWIIYSIPASTTRRLAVVELTNKEHKIRVSITISSEDEESNFVTAGIGSGSTA